MRKVVFTLMILLLVCFAFPHGVMSLDEFEPGIKLIKTEELKMWLDQKEDFVLINTLSPLEFRDASIPGSINLPYSYIKEGTEQLPGDKNKRMVFY